MRLVNTVIIGSTAIKHHFPDFNRVPKDLDYAIENLDDKIQLQKILADFKRTEFKPIPTVEFLENPVILKYAKSEVLDPDLMLTLKASHIFWDIDWDKHMWDIQFLLKKRAKIQKEVFYELYEYWNKYHEKNTRSDLKMSAADFFDNALKEFDHDHLHTLINPTPTYTTMLADGAEVEIDEQKFENAPDEAKENLIREEVMVMAFERFRKLPYKRAYLRMFKKYLISHAPLYVALWAIERYPDLMRAEYNFVKKIQEKL
jgi:hypothetical protein